MDAQIRDIYNKILTEKYIEMGTSLRYQDFFAPVSIIRGIKELRIETCIKSAATKKSQNLVIVILHSTKTKTLKRMKLLFLIQKKDFLLTENKNE